MIFLNVSIVTTSHPKKIIFKPITQRSIVKTIFLNALSVINICPECDDLKKHIKTVLEKDKNVNCNQCNLSTRAK